MSITVAPIYNHKGEPHVLLDNLNPAWAYGLYNGERHELVVHRRTCARRFRRMNARGTLSITFQVVQALYRLATMQSSDDPARIEFCGNCMVKRAEADR